MVQNMKGTGKIIKQMDKEDFYMLMEIIVQLISYLDEGEFVNNLCCGFGVYQYTNGHRYEGLWRNDKCNGFGKEFWPDGSCY